MARSPVDMCIDEWVYDLLAVIERHQIKRVLIDSLADLSLAATDPIRFREWMYSLTQRCSRLGVSPLMTLEVPELFRLIRLSEDGMSHVADNVLLLQYIRRASGRARALTVLKTRASGHQQVIRQFEITGAGIVLGEPVDAAVADLLPVLP